MLLGKKPVKRLEEGQKKQRGRRLAMSRVTRFLKNIVREAVRKVPEMRLDRAGRKFRKKQKERSEPEMLSSCKMLLEKLSIGSQEYFITNPLSPNTAACLAGVPSLEFWSVLGPLTEEDFFLNTKEDDPDMENLAKNLKRTIIIEKTGGENRDDNDDKGGEDDGRSGAIVKRWTIR